MRKFTDMEPHKDVDKFKIGIDVHGVIDAMPDFFSFLTQAIIEAGGEVHIITGGSGDTVLEEIRPLNIKWTHLFSVYDYMVENFEPEDGVVIFPDGTRQKKFKGKDWDVVKGEYCKKNNIQLHIDDKKAYKEFFKTPYALLYI